MVNFWFPILILGTTDNGFYRKTGITNDNPWLAHNYNILKEGPYTCYVTNQAHQPVQSIRQNNGTGLWRDIVYNSQASYH